MKQAHQTRHIVHIAVAAVPTILLIGSYMVDLFNLPATVREPSLELGRISFYMIAAGLVTMIITSLPGLADYSPMRKGEPNRSVAVEHFWISALAFLCFAGCLVVRWVWPVRLGPPLVPIALSTFGAGFLGYTCYLGYRLMNPAVESASDDIMVYDRKVEAGRWPEILPGVVGSDNWKKAEADAQRWRVEPRVDAGGDTI